MRKYDIAYPAILVAMTVMQISLAPWIKPLVPGVRLGFEFALINGTLLAFAVYVAQKSNFWVGLFMAFSVFSAHYPASTNISRETLFFISIGVLWYHIVVQSSVSEKAWLNAICIVALLNAGMLLIQAFDLDFTFRTPKYEPIISGFAGNVPVGLMSCPNEVSAIIAICFAAFFRNRWVCCIPLLLFGLWQAHTFAGPMSVGCAIIVCILFFGKCSWASKTVGISLMLWLLLMYALLCDIPDIAWRWRTWKIGLFYIYPQRPFFGFGLGHWQKIFSLPQLIVFTDGKAFYQAHNDFVQFILQMGIPFVVCLCGYLSRLIRNVKSVCGLCLFAIVAMAADANVFFPFHNPLIAGVCITWLGLSEKRVRSLSR